ncbi:DUF1643 domain-containing protein [Cellulomonas composti]|uniref:DUF1643 domain-containing protein n=1 Tax=Cellulomonas composti TaxID=266130 RepID=A0A511J6S1_9CELL|nr:DUF1643 domain-containing protein [Cellulomonas composti]GEL93700.1 hypothetical protein CCO02nite_03580 [Cellulomonas composti]
MPDRFTSVHVRTDRTVAISDRGWLSRSEAIAAYRRHFQAQLDHATRALAATDDDLVVETHAGAWDGPRRPRSYRVSTAHAGATISSDGRYRYTLTRSDGNGGDLATFVMLNPSTADDATDDPTIRRCVEFARRWGLDGIVVVNLYAWRATNPRELAARARGGCDIVGPENDAHIVAAIREAAGPVIAAWGAQSRIDSRVEDVLALPGMQTVHHLGLTKSGAPRHPLYVRGDTPLTPWLAPLPTGAVR